MQFRIPYFSQQVKNKPHCVVANCTFILELGVVHKQKLHRTEEKTTLDKEENIQYSLKTMKLQNPPGET
jgi:hypothetical protein